MPGNVVGVNGVFEKLFLQYCRSMGVEYFETRESRMSSTFGSIIQAHNRAVLNHTGKVIDASNGVRGHTWAKCREFFKNECAYCGKPLGPKEGHREHVYPMNTTEFGWGCGCVGDVVLACKECDNNDKKGAVRFEDLIRMKSPSVEVASSRIAKIELYFKMCRFVHDPDLVRSIAEPYIVVFEKQCDMMEEKIKREINLSHPTLLSQKTRVPYEIEIDTTDIFYGI